MYENLGEVHSPYIDALNYNVAWAMCPKCHRMFKLAYRGLLPVWENQSCPFCMEKITPIALEKNSKIEKFNPSKREHSID